MTVDPVEIDKFDRLTERWWDPEGEFAPLHAINPLRLGYIASRCELAGARVADIGCGGGLLSEALVTSGARVTGIDAGAGAIDAATRHARESGLSVDYRHTTVEEFAAEHAGRFDVVTCMELIEHVPQPDGLVEACATLVRPGGSVFFSTINRNPKAWLFAVVGAEYLLNMLPRGTHDYSRFVRPSELAAFGRNAALELRDVTGMHYNPLTRRYTLGHNVDVNYLMHFERLAAPTSL